MANYELDNFETESMDSFELMDDTIERLDSLELTDDAVPSGIPRDFVGMKTKLLYHLVNVSSLVQKKASQAEIDALFKQNAELINELLNWSIEPTASKRVRIEETEDVSNVAMKILTDNQLKPNAFDTIGGNLQQLTENLSARLDQLDQKMSLIQIDTSLKKTSLTDELTNQKQGFDFISKCINSLNDNVNFGNQQTTSSLNEDQNTLPIPLPPNKPLDFTPNTNEQPDCTRYTMYCKLCKKQHENMYNLKIHQKNAHNIDVDEFPTEEASKFVGYLKCELCRNALNPDQNNRISAGRSYCKLCKKEMCNKYFMKTHQEKMHGINFNELSAEEASKLVIPIPSFPGAVRCDLCTKEFCSENFLKWHKMNSHGIVMDAMDAMDELSNKQDDLSNFFNSLNSYLNSSSQQTTNSLNADQSNLPTSLPPNKPSVIDPNAERRYVCKRDGKELRVYGNLKTHLKSHGIDIDKLSVEKQSKYFYIKTYVRSRTKPGTTKGVKCDLCAKELCSEYFLKVHKLNTHGITME